MDYSRSDFTNYKKMFPTCTAPIEHMKERVFFKKYKKTIKIFIFDLIATKNLILNQTSGKTAKNVYSINKYLVGEPWFSWDI